jgi:hypothetical protein
MTAPAPTWSSGASSHAGSSGPGRASSAMFPVVAIRLRAVAGLVPPPASHDLVRLHYLFALGSVEPAASQLLVDPVDRVVQLLAQRLAFVLRLLHLGVCAEPVLIQTSGTGRPSSARCPSRVQSRRRSFPWRGCRHYLIHGSAGFLKLLPSAAIPGGCRLELRMNCHAVRFGCCVNVPT